MKTQIYKQEIRTYLQIPQIAAINFINNETSHD